jgi:hypothetical protein
LSHPCSEKQNKKSFSPLGNQNFAEEIESAKEGVLNSTVVSTLKQDENNLVSFTTPFGKNDLDYDSKINMNTSAISAGEGVGIFVMNADSRFFDKEQFILMFGQCGDILRDISIEPDSASTLMAQIKFASKEQASMAISRYNGKRFDRFKLIVSLA